MLNEFVNCDINPKQLSDLNYYIHKLNNMLTSIQGNAELIKLKAGFNDEAKDILICCEKSIIILKYLRQFSGC